MIDAAPLGEVGIAILDCAPDRGDLAQALVDPFWLRHRGNSQQRYPVVQRPKHSLDEGVLTAADQRRIEVRLGFKGCHQVGFSERGLQPRESISDPAYDFRVAQTCAFTSGKSFEHGTCRVELLGFLKTDGA